jgi:hypothetical protein
MVMLGESVIHLLVPNIDNTSRLLEHYLFSFLGFVLLLMLALQFFDCEPGFGQHVLLHSAFRGRCWIFLHSPLAYALLLTGVGLKALAHSAGHGLMVSREASVFIGVAAFLSGLLITTVRIMHKGIRSFSERRFVTYILRFGLTSLHLVVHLVAKKLTGLILVLHLAIAFSIVVVDTVGQRNKAKKNAGGAFVGGGAGDKEEDEATGGGTGSRGERTTEMTNRFTTSRPVINPVSRSESDVSAELELGDAFNKSSDSSNVGGDRSSVGAATKRHDSTSSSGTEPHNDNLRRKKTIGEGDCRKYSVF